MCNLSLRWRIATRKQEAKNKKLNDKAFEVTSALGSRRVVLFTTFQGYSETDLEIMTRCTGLGDSRVFGAVITYKDITVFETLGEAIIAYIPGPWEEILERLHLQALEARPELAPTEQKKTSKLAEEARRFGL